MFNCCCSTDANSTEFNDKTSHPVVIEMPEHNPGNMGGTMRLGKRKTIFRHKDTVLGKITEREGEMINRWIMN